MQVSQSYATPSSTATDATGMKFNLSAELSRPPVRLNALIKNSLAYARIMLALRKVVAGDWRLKPKDNSAYQEWVNERYIEELPQHLQGLKVDQIKLLQQRETLKAKKKLIEKEYAPLNKKLWEDRYKYFQWLYTHNRDQWIMLDPVISVHPDSVIFEGFSIDESAYGRVSVPNKNLETFGQVDYGTTNIDFSLGLANELYRVRSYRPAWLNVAFDKVELSTELASNVEKKIDLPDSWVRGFLQVQSASTIDGVMLNLHSSTVAQFLEKLEQRKEKESPRSVRFILKKGECPILVIDPWNVQIKDTNVYNGDFEGEIRLWGRRRLFVLRDLLPFTDSVQVKLLGTGMPSYWSVEVEGHRFDLGLSGWTANDWSKKGNFDLLAASQVKVSAEMLKNVEKTLIQYLTLSPKQLAENLNIKQEEATVALQDMCKSGQAMYDHLLGTYRYRNMLEQEIVASSSEEDIRLTQAVTIVKENKAKMLQKGTLVEDAIAYNFEVEGEKTTYKVDVKIDLDGRIKFAECTCGFFKRNKLRQGPCQHIMAAAIWVGRN